MSAALFLVALITLTGCPTSADDDGSTTVVYGHRIYGANVTPYQAQQAIDNAIKAGEPVVLEDGLSIANDPIGALNFKDAQVRINGRVFFDGGVMNMADANVSWVPGAEVRMIGGYYIHRQGMDISGKVNEDAWVWFAESLEAIRPTATAAAVREFKLGPKQDFDYSRDSGGVDARISAPGLRTLFILDKLTIPSEATAPSAQLEIEAVGTVDFTGTVPVSVFAGNRITLDTSATLTSSRGATITVTANTPIIIPNVRVEAERGITLLQDNPNTLTIAGKLTGPGTLTVPSTDITINGGDGNLIVSNQYNDNRKLFINSTGRTAFAGDLIIFNNSVIYSSPVVFGGNVTVKAPLALYGDVILGHGPLGNGQIITVNNPVTLGAGKTITLQISPQKSTKIIPAPLLSAVGDVVLESAGNTTFTTPERPKDTEADIAEAKLITLGGGDLEIINGTLQVAPDAAFSIDTGLRTRSNGIAKEFGYLAVANGGTLSLEPASGIALGSPVTTTISGPFNFTAAGGTVTLGNYRITGSAAGTNLTPGKGTSGSISVGGATGILVLDGLELNLATYSNIRLLAAGGRVVLDRGAKLTLTAGEGGQPTTFTTITATNTASLTGAFTGLTPDATSAKQTVLSVAHRGGDLAEVNIVANAPITLGKSPRATFTQ